MRKHEDAHKCRVCKGGFKICTRLVTIPFPTVIVRVHRRRTFEKEEFKTKLGLDVHMKQHEDDKKFEEVHECEKCARTFESAVQLKFHMTSAHDKDVTGYECKQCGKMLSSENSLQVHMETHEFLEELEIRCKVCRKTFTTEKALMLHEETAHIEEVIIKVSVFTCIKADAIIVYSMRSSV